MQTIIEYINQCIDKKQSISEIANTIDKNETNESIKQQAFQYLMKLKINNIINNNF